ncbi:hypothetical protein [Devosia sp. Root436]|uniref:hypothetical protein n=1 Tax=Devosia sp. Root436 TaxID=1736537 RepID=UPI000A8DA3AC|nr:hypothetical protein [Devosia sp. Root436]
MSRRVALTGMGAALSSAALGAATVPALAAAPGADDPETIGLSGLALAAVHIERAVQAMAPVTFGRWSVKIHSGQPDQSWCFHQETNLVLRAINLHRRASEAVDQALERRNAAQARMEANPRYEWRPRVQVGQYVAMGGNPGAPIYAYDVDDIERHSKQWQGLGLALHRPEEAEAYRVKFAGLRDELEAKLRRKKRIEYRSGYSAADKALSAAWRAEEVAAIALVLVQPATPRDEAEKRAYIRGKPSFEMNNWDVETLFDALRANVGGLRS